MVILHSIDGHYRLINLFSPWLWKFTITLRESREFSLPQIFCITYTIMNKHYIAEPVNRHIQPLINMMQENNRLITTKTGLG